MDDELGYIELVKRTGSEEIIVPNKKRTLLDFWQWAFSDLIGNTERGPIAEYIVAMACDIEDNVRIGWDAFDLVLKNGIKIEVKSSAYLQRWKQKSFSKPIFRIPKTLAWDYKENIYENEKKRQADVYVFALLAHTDKATLNPLDTRQWEFYVVNTRLIDKEIKDSKQITLQKIQELGAVKSTFDQLLTNILLENSK